MGTFIEGDTDNDNQYDRVWVRRFACASAVASAAWYLAISESYNVLTRLTIIVELVKYHIGVADVQTRGNIPIVIPIWIYTCATSTDRTLFVFTNVCTIARAEHKKNYNRPGERSF
jgi:hypothetical protein